MNHKFHLLVLALSALFIFPSISHAQVSSYNSLEYSNAFEYSDSESDISFVVPDNWQQEPLSAEREVVKAKFSSPDKASLIIYGSYDLWSQLTSSEKQGLTRSSIDQTYVSIEEITELYSIPKTSVKNETYGGNEYYVFPVSLSVDSTGVSINSSSIQALHFSNGFMFQFQFYGDKNGADYKDFLNLLSSVTYVEVSQIPTSAIKATDSQQNNFSIDIGGIILSLIITVALYTLPIAVYRYAIRKRPCETKTGKKISIAYGVSAFVIISIISYMNNGTITSGTAVLFWSYINYKILVGSTKTNNDEDPARNNSALPLTSSSESNIALDSDAIISPTQPTAPETTDIFDLDNDSSMSNRSNEGTSSSSAGSPDIIPESEDRSAPSTADPTLKTFCHMCGVQLPNNAKFCNRCGTKL